MAKPSAMATWKYAALSPAMRAWRWVALVVLGVVTLVGLGGAAAWLFAPEPEAPAIEIISVPPGASVRLDGEEVPGATPVRVTDGLVPGQTHEVEVSMPGYQTWSTSLEPGQGLVKQIAVLTPIRGTLRIESEPTGAHVWVDDVLYGSTPIEVAGLPLGRDIQLRAKKSGFQDARETVRITEEELEPTVVLEFERK